MNADVALWRGHDLVVPAPQGHSALMNFICAYLRHLRIVFFFFSYGSAGSS